jgi:hypothetical protein
MSLHNLAQQIQAQGRGNDTQLLHVTPRELNAMQGLARSHGGSLTVNPHTGLPEAGFLDNLIPSLLPIAAGAALTATGIGAPLAAGIVGAGTGLLTHDLNKGLMAGLGAFGGASLAGGLMEAGTSALAEPAIASGAEVAGQTAAGTGAQAWGTDASLAANAAQQGATAAPAESALSGVSQPTPAVAPSAWDKMQAGFKATNFDTNYLKQNMLPIGAAAAPLLMGGLGSTSSTDNQTTQNPSYIRPYAYRATPNPSYTGAGTPALNQSYTAGAPVLASDWGSRPIYMASGGIAALANGGANPQGGVAALGGQNNMYPMSQMDHTQYATPTQMPTSAEVVNAGYEEKTNPYTGDEVRMADGGTAQLNMSNRYSTPTRMANPDVAAYNNLLAQRAQQEYVQQPQLSSMVPQQLRQTATPQYQAPNLTPIAGMPNAAPAASDQNASLQAQQAALQQFEPVRDASYYGSGGGNANGGLMQSYAMGGIANLGSYSDGGHLLKGPGDGVSDDIPATIGGKQPARLADGEFVVPARIVSELGNGSTDAGAKRLYQMMERVQANRGKTVGKGKVAVDSKASKFLPA